MLWHVDPLLGNRRRNKQLHIGRYYTAARKQQEGTVFSARSVPMAKHLTVEYVMPPGGLLWHSRCELLL
jgi:hypothetical protein